MLLGDKIHNQRNIIEKSLAVYTLLLKAKLASHRAKRRFTRMLIFHTDANNVITFCQYAALPQNPGKLIINSSLA